MYFRFLFALMLAMDLLWWRRADRRLRTLLTPPRNARRWRIALAVFIGSLVGCMLLFVIAPALVRRAHGFLPLPLHVLVYLWHMLVLPITWIVLLSTDAVGTASRCLRKAFGHARPTTPSPATPDPATAPAVSRYPALSRRQLLGAAAVALPPLVATGITGYSITGLGQFRVQQIDLPIPNLPRDLNGLRIAHVSDMHVGKFTVGDMLSRVIDATNRTPTGERPHLVLLTGDLIDLSVTDLPAALDFVKRLDPLHALAMCEGNHDLIDDPRRFYSGVQDSGVPLLLDGEQTLELPGRPTPVQLLGLRWAAPDARNERGRGGEHQIAPAMSRLLPLRRQGAFPILLAHHPHAFDPAAAAGLPLTLAGHTHGGQITLAGRASIAALVYRYWSGLYEKGDSKLFVSNGVGNWFPLRINTPAEVVHLTLRRA